MRLRPSSSRTGGDRLASARTVASALRGATLLVVLDGLIVGQGFSAFVGLWTLFVSLPRAWLDRDGERRRRRFRRAGIYLGAVVLIVGWIMANQIIAERRANALVASVKAFKVEHQRYPDRLQELVPRFAPTVPLAKYILLEAPFIYYRSKDRPLLMYFVAFPFGRSVYNFEKDRWSFLD